MVGPAPGGAGAWRPLRHHDPEYPLHDRPPPGRRRPRRGPTRARCRDGAMVAPRVPRPALDGLPRTRPDRPLLRRRAGRLGAESGATGGCTAVRSCSACRSSGSSCSNSGAAPRWRRPRRPPDPARSSARPSATPVASSAEREPWACAHAQLLRAGVAAARGDRAAALSLFASTADRFDAVDMKLDAAAARRRLGELLGGGPGQALISRVDDWMRSQTIRDPALLVAVIAPGSLGKSGTGDGR